MHFYGSASAEPFFLAPFPENWGARLRISGGCPARGEPEARIDLCSSIACRAQPCQRCTPVLQALILSQYAFYGSASAEPFFCCSIPGELGSTTAHLRRLPRKGRAGGAYRSLLKHRVQGAALPAMHPSSPSADFISVCNFTALLRQSRFCFKGESAAKRCVPPFFARQTVLYYNCIGACRKGSKPVRFTQGSVSRARCTEKAVF
mgnify:CR=1 FL=1